MSVSDVSSLAADVIAALSLAYSVASGRKSRAAKMAAQNSEDRANSMVNSMEAMAESLQKLASSAGVSSPTEDNKRVPSITSATQLPPSIAQPTADVRFTLELGPGDTYMLRNAGTGTATRVTLTFPNQANFLVRNLPRDVVLEPFQSVRFIMAASPGTYPPIAVVSSAQTGDVEVSVPPKR